MSEPIPACLAIGGRLPARLVAPLCEAIIADGVALEWGEAPFRQRTAQELLETCREEHGVNVLWLCDDQANWGRLPGLEAFLLKRAKLPFDLRAAGKAEFDPDLVAFRPGRKPVRLLTTARGEPVVEAQRLKPIVSALTSAVQTSQASSPRAFQQRVARASPSSGNRSTFHRATAAV